MQTNVTAPGTTGSSQPDTHATRLEHDPLEAGWSGPQWNVRIPWTGSHTAGRTPAAAVIPHMLLLGSQHKRASRPLFTPSHPRFCCHELLTSPQTSEAFLPRLGAFAGDLSSVWNALSRKSVWQIPTHSSAEAGLLGELSPTSLPRQGLFSVPCSRVPLCPGPHSLNLKVCYFICKRGFTDVNKA